MGASILVLIFWWILGLCVDGCDQEPPASDGPRHEHDVERPQRTHDGHVEGVVEEPPDLPRHHAERDANLKVLQPQV